MKATHKGKEITARYLLTDGVEITERREMTRDEFERANRDAVDATDGNWWWCEDRNQSGVNFPTTKSEGK